MAETRVFKTRGGWRHALGVSSLLLSLCSGALFLLLVVLTRAATRAMTSPVTGEIDAPGLAPLVILLGFVCLLPALVAMSFAAAALVKPGRGWAMAVAGWMVGVWVLWYAGAQEALWSPFGGGPKHTPEPEVVVVHEAPPPEGAQRMEWANPEAVMGEGGRPPAGPPEAVLTSTHRDAIGFEGTFCWTPEWAANCAEDAGIPLLPEDETIAVKQGQAADLVFVLRASEGEFAERNPVPTRAVAYPLGQEAKTVPAQMGVRYLVPAGRSQALEKKELDMKHQSDSRETPDEPEDGLTKVVADVPAGEYVFQISARSPEGVDYWKVATYHFRVLVLAAE